ncbi:filamentous hemagglutinin N-terminal domain-containing protein [Nostoc sp. FACHB-133]|uniref:two-partner secretion domain-containing protein n=1 Tax=Nostoc sp. FACHB-133 TaxID=2692835 RepID=UPI001688B9B4|nr:filamentous hemagglutinin N-terminal domain-containing protein [Nostoc sp. FACHB-133]MBD2525608.1 filamentous hemagglutinin N-terminal domain-containing protein [Nostoc sp. FACHB-133]
METKHYTFIKLVFVSTFISSLTIFPCKAQIIKDGTLPNNSIIKTQGNTITIEGGTQAENNLFHSFQNFSVSNGGIVLFNNSANIQNIISRVTGTSASNIDGLIRANGTANLFLINPNGIVFGQNARLDIGGSFLASTANSIKFTDGSQFSAVNTPNQPILTISVPSGLQFGSNLGVIQVQGTGRIIQDSDFRVPLDANKFSNSLQVKPDKTLALIGGDILLEGGILSTKNGRIELGSIAKGDTNIKQENNGWSFSYDKTSIFGDIKLSENALVYVNSLKGEGNTINIQGRNIRILNGSLIFSQNQEYKQNGEITVNASELLELKDSTQFSLSAIFTSNFGKTAGENIQINANKINIEGSQIATTTFSDASGGNIVVNNVDNLKIIGSDPSTANPFGYGGINTFSYINHGVGGNIVGKIKTLILENRANITTNSSSYGSAGDVKLSTENITLKNGGGLGSTTFNMGKGGNVFVNASNQIEIIGVSPSVGASTIKAGTFGSGDAGILEINTPRLSIREGAGVSTSTVSSGNSGSLTINAPDFIEVSGVDSNSNNPSFIDSSAAILDESLRVRFSRVPPNPTGDAGKLTLKTGSLNIKDGAQVSVGNYGSGNAGKLEIIAKDINIKNNGSVNATTAVGQGGDIDIGSENLLLRNSSISTTAGQQGTNGDGGNIAIDTKILFSLGNSSITANAFTGEGGNIFINTDWFFYSLNSRFEASSQFGINGQVDINGFYFYPNSMKAAPEAIRETPKIASLCQSRSGIGISKFVVTGIDSLLPSPNDLPSNNPIWQDNSISDQVNISSEELKSIVQETAPIIEAQALISKPDGTVVLTAKSDLVTADAALFASLCSAEAKTSRNQ